MFTKNYPIGRNISFYSPIDSDSSFYIYLPLKATISTNHGIQLLFFFAKHIPPRYIYSEGFTDFPFTQIS